MPVLQLVARPHRNFLSQNDQRQPANDFACMGQVWEVVAHRSISVVYVFVAFVCTNQAFCVCVTTPMQSTLF